MPEIGTQYELPYSSVETQTGKPSKGIRTLGTSVYLSPAKARKWGWPKKKKSKSRRRKSTSRRRSRRSVPKCVRGRKVRTGPRGGKFIMVKGRKEYV